MCATAFNTTLRKSLKVALSGDADAEKIASRVRESLSYLKQLDPATREVVRECYGKSTRAALAVGTGLVVGSMFFSWFIKEKKLGK
jgi:hypothetical protein